MKFKIVEERFTEAVFVHHVLEGLPPPSITTWQQQTSRYNQPRFRSINPRFIQWLSIEKHRAQLIQSLISESANQDVAFARVWMIISKDKSFFYETPEIHKRVLNAAAPLKVYPREWKIFYEINEWIIAAEKNSLLLAYLKVYQNENLIKAQKVKKCHDALPSRLRRPSTALNMTTAVRSKIRHIVEERQNLIFNDAWTTVSEPISPKEVKDIICKQITAFYEIFKKKIDPLFSDTEKKKKFLEITLCQEYTKAAHASIKNFIETLQKFYGIICIECWLNDDRLTVSLRMILEELKAPIELMLKNDKVKISPEEAEDINEQINAVIEKLLFMDEIYKAPLIFQFSKLIKNEQISYSASENELAEWLKEYRNDIIKMEYCPNTITHNIFSIHLKQIWKTLRERAQKNILDYSRKLRENFHENLIQLQQEFHRFKRILSFRSMESSLMLLNKAEVTVLCEHDIPLAVEELSQLYSRMHDLSQVIAFDSNDHELLISIVALRRSLPRQITDHRMFFQRRLHIFTNFVKGRQKAVQEHIQKSTDKLRLINTFTNPAEVDFYLTEMATLKPLICTLMEELRELNQFEQVVNFPITRIPLIELLENHIEAFVSLFTWAKEFRDREEEFYNRSRVNANVEEFRTFVDKFIEVVSELNTQLEGQKSGKHFIIQLWSEVEKVRHCFGIVDVLSCNRLKEWHWSKMSDIVGFDLTQFVDATVAQIAELGINHHYARLKPIVYIAEREGIVSDQTNYIINYWQKAVFVVEESTFWSVYLPTNLKILVKDAAEHIAKLKSFYEPDSNVSAYSNDLSQWIKDIRTLHSIMSKWVELLRLWNTVSSIMHYSHDKMPKEFLQFRTCAKYWQRFGEHIKNDSRVLKLLSEKHAKCWIRLSQSHLHKLINGVKAYFGKIRQQNARIAVMSDFDMLKLLSDIPLERRLRIIRRVCFPLLTDIYVNHKGQICVVNTDGERVCLGNLAHIDFLRKQGTFAFIAYLAEAINMRIIEEYKKCLERQEMTTTSLKVARMLSDNVQHGIQDSAFKYILKESVLRLHLKGTDKEIHLNLDFIPVSQNLETLGISLAHKWADGKVPLLVGGRQECRVVIRRMAQNMCTPVHIINSHNDLHEDVVQRCTKAAQMNSIIFVFEHIDQLSETLLITLFQCIAGIHNCICPRLVLCSTIEVQDEKIASPNIHIEHIMKVFDFLATPQRSMLSPSPSDTLQIGLLVAERRTSVRRRHSTPKPTTLAESLYTVLRHPESTETIGGMDVACIGPFARSIVSEMLSLYKDPATWIYIDTYANEQLVREGESFGLPPVGYLIDCLKSSWIDANEALLHARRESLGENVQGHRTSIKQNICHFIIFYGHQHLENYFPYLSSLICTNTGTNTQWPISFLTLPDGSNFTVAPDVQFILCTPSKQKNVVDLLSRYNVETLLMDSEIRPSTKEIWIREKKSFEELLGKADYLSVVSNSIEQIIIPLIEYHQFHKQMDFEFLIQLLREDIKEVLPYVFPANCGEILRATICSTSFNYLLIYLKDIVEKFDASVVKFAAEADKHIIDPGKLPDQVSQYKISEMDYTRWIKWSEEVHVPSTIDKDSSISDIFITYPNFDRILTFAQRQFLATDQHLLFCGPQNSGKTALVQRFIKHINSLSDAFIFYWLKPFNRFNLLKMQKILQNVLERQHQTKKIVLVVDCFAFNETTSGFLELLVNEKQIIVNGAPQNYEYDFRLIIIMNDTEYEKCYEKKIFVDNFISIFVHSPTKDELALIFEGLVTWHFQSQAFSGEYISLVTSLSAVAIKLFTTASIQPKRLLPYIIRLSKGIMFSSPENAPDIDSILRLFIHEIIRVAVDRNLKKKAKTLFFTKINGAMIEECGTKIETLFPTKKHFIEEDSSDFYLMKKTENVTVGMDFTLEKLMFSELAAQETMEGIAYSLVTDKEEFIRNVENLHFEFSKNHEDWQINLAVTDYVAEHCQRIMRVCRQAGEHLALAGRIGSGRYQCLKLSTFGVIGQIHHVFVNANNPNEFEKSWKRVMQECVILIAKTNQPVNVVFHFDHIIKTIPQQWLGMLKHWLLTPTLDGLITDDNILKHGEQIVDCERTLATIMQSSNIRLPGQRYCQFVSLEALKDIEQLKSLLSARIVDFLHAIFLIPPESLPLFEWCSADHFLPLTNEEEKIMGQKILSECVFPKKEHLLETLQNIFETTMELFTDHHPSFDVRLWFQLCQKTTNIYNTRTSAIQGQITMLNDALKTLSRIRQLSTMGGKVSTEELKSDLDDTDLILLMQKRHLNEDSKALDELTNTITEVEKNCNETEIDILQLQAKIDAILDEPQKAFVIAAEEISEFSNSDFKKLAITLKPTLAIRYSIEVLRRVIDPSFQSKKSTIETWPHLQGFIKQPNLLDQVKLFNVYSIDQNRLKLLKNYTENREMRIAKLETESRLAAVICKWVLAAIDVAEANLSVSEEQNGVKIAWEKLHQEREKLIVLQKEKEKLEKSVAALKHNVDALEQKITKIKRTINYRQRGTKIDAELSSLEPRWGQQIQTLNRLMNNLIGNSIYDAAFQTFLLDATPETRQSLCVKWGTILLRASLGYEQRYCTSKNLLLNKLRTVDSREPYPLVYDKTNTLINASSCIADKHITLKVPDSHGWLNQNFINEIQRCLHSDSTLIIQNVTASPPLEWYSILIREPEKGMINLVNRSCRFNISNGIIFITQNSLQQFSTQFLDTITPVIFHEKVTEADIYKIQQTMSQDEEKVLRILSEYAGVDILDSQEITEQLIFVSEILLTNIKGNI